MNKIILPPNLKTGFEYTTPYLILFFLLINLPLLFPPEVHPLAFEHEHGGGSLLTFTLPD